jgi:hypothetical protein
MGPFCQTIHSRGKKSRAENKRRAEGRKGDEREEVSAHYTV